MRFADAMTCPQCHGNGDVPAGPCPRCGGSGEIIHCWATRPGQREAHDLTTCSHYRSQGAQ